MFFKKLIAKLHKISFMHLFLMIFFIFASLII